MNIGGTVIFTMYYFTLMYIGFLIAKKIPEAKKWQKYNSKWQEFLLYGLLFFLALRLGSYESVISNLSTIGWQGLALVSGIIVSVFGGSLVLYLALKRKV